MSAGIINGIKELMHQYELDQKAYDVVEQAFYHSSYINEVKADGESNERLEFLGDGVLNLIIASYLYKMHKDLPEGELTKKRAQLVREEALVIYANTIKLADKIFLGKGEEKTGGRNRPAIIADAFEAFIGAIFITHGFEKAQEVLLKIVEPVFAEDKLENVTDYKSMFQELIQVDPTKKIYYQVVKEEGQPHERTYHVSVYVDDFIYGTGKGRTKKEAEQQAAFQAIDKLV